MLWLLLSLALLALARQPHRKVHDGAPFSWDNCGSSSDPLSVKSLQISPNPIVLGQDINIQTLVRVGNAITNMTFQSVALTIETKTLGVWIEIPCVDGVGSCTYNGADLCAQLGEHAADNCPKLKPAGLPCECPFNAGTYQTPAGGLTIPTKNPGLSWLTSGDFYIKAVVTNLGKQALCLEVYLSLGN